MSGLPEFFEQTSDEPYDRHTYQLFLTNGETMDVDDWMTVSAAWFQLPAMFTDHIEVLDRPKPKSKPIGF